MKPENKNNVLQLPLEFDRRRLEEELQTCLKLNWPQHFNSNDFSGDWSGISLRSTSGKENDINSIPGSDFKNTPLLEACPYFLQILNEFKCEKETVRLLRLAPGSIIKEHRDRGTAYPFGNFRLHICITTNSNISFVVDQQEIEMHPGECWYADFDRPHSVINNGNEERIHLIIDCIRNDWTDILFEEAGYDFKLEKTLVDESTHLRIIEELQRMNTTTSIKMINELNQKRNAQ